MTSNAILGTLMHFFLIGDMQPEAINYWLVCIPLVVIGAPFGAYTVNKINRISIAVMLYIIILAQFVAALFIIRPSGPLMIVSVITFFVGIVLFFFLTSSHDDLQMQMASEE
jgi:hypothetical protein